MCPAPRRPSILSAFIRWVDDWDNRLAFAAGVVAAVSTLIHLGESLTR